MNETRFEADRPTPRELTRRPACAQAAGESKDRRLFRSAVIASSVPLHRRGELCDNIKSFGVDRTLQEIRPRLPPSARARGSAPEGPEMTRLGSEGRVPRRWAAAAVRSSR